MRFRKYESPAAPAPVVKVKCTQDSQPIEQQELPSSPHSEPPGRGPGRAVKRQAWDPRPRLECSEPSRTMQAGINPQMDKGLSGHKEAHINMVKTISPNHTGARQKPRPAFTWLPDPPTDPRN